MLSQSRLCAGLSHDWSRVWNFHSNIHESRPALHHLCASSWVPGMRTRQNGEKKNKLHFNRGEKQERENERNRERGKSREQWMRPHVSLRRCLFLLARHDFTTASLFADMTSLMQTEPMPSSISKKTPNTFMQVAPLLCGNLQQPYKLFLGFDKSCSVYYYTWYRGETQIPQKCCGWSGTA